jgi:hypothetical protein
MNTIEELVICPFCEKSIIKHFPTFRDHINEHDQEIKDMLENMDDSLNKCSICGDLVKDDNWHEFRKCCDFCLNVEYRG